MNTQHPLTILIADDHPLLRTAVKHTLRECWPEIRLIEVESFGSLERALAAVAQLPSANDACGGPDTLTLSRARTGFVRISGSWKRAPSALLLGGDGAARPNDHLCPVRRFRPGINSSDARRSTMLCSHSTRCSTPKVCCSNSIVAVQGPRWHITSR